MYPFPCSEYTVAPNIFLTIFEIREITPDIENILDKNLISICEGNSDSSLSTIKKHIKNLFQTKNDTWIMGATSEFFIHLYMKLSDYKQECLFFNLEEGSIKKGFDGYYSKNNIEWIMESKSGSAFVKGNTHASKVTEAMKDLENKIIGNTSNNPWRNAYHHANLYDVGTAKEIRKNIKKLSDDFDSGIFSSINDLNTIPCGTLYFSGIYVDSNHETILQDIKKISTLLKGKKIHVICATHTSAKLFIDYILKGV